ncbi:MAG: hypothetical protein ACLFTA_01220 [Candidatus Nanohaloarchaea archaeon]
MESIYSFEDGPYKVLNYEVIQKKDRFFIEVNGGDLGRLPIESMDAVEELRESLEKIEAELKEMKRRNEEL